MKSLLVIAALCFGQETPQPTPAPEPTITVTATPQVPLGHWVRIVVKTTGTHPRVRVRQTLPGEDTYLPMDDGSGTTGILSLGSGAYVLAWSQGEFVIEADAQTPDGTITALSRSIIGDPLPPVVPPGPITPPVVKTLADLAGDKAPALAKAYGEMLEALDKKLFIDLKHFRTVEAAFLADRGLTGHGATAEIAARLNVATLADLQPALVKVVAELGTPTPEPITASQAVYVYEKDQGGVPPAVHAALSELNAKGIRANAIDDDVTDGSGEIPDQYKAALIAARQVGLPALVVTDGQNVKRVVKAPTTKEQVLEAAR